MSILKKENQGDLFLKLLEKRILENNFIINNYVLTPRPETELIIEKILHKIPGNSAKKIDIGTGSGCIIISILLERQNCNGTAVDLSKESIKIAKTNAKIQQIQNRIKFIHSDIDKYFANKYDFIVSNPPYIKKYKQKNLKRM